MSHFCLDIDLLQKDKDAVISKCIVWNVEKDNRIIESMMVPGRIKGVFCLEAANANAFALRKPEY